MKKLLWLCIFFFGATVNAQECPADKICLSRQAAEKALVDAETVKAQEAEIATLKQAVTDEKEVANKLKIEFAEAKGEITALRQNDVANRAIIQLLVQKVGKRCSPLSILCL